MPITPLHFGVMAPIFFWQRSWMALISFTIINAWIDMQAIYAWTTGMPLPGHEDAFHTMDGAMASATVLSILGGFNWRWVFGAFYGAITHIYLDAWVHQDVRFFGNREPGDLYLGPDALPWISGALLPLLIWLIGLIVRHVSDTRGVGPAQQVQDARQSDQRSP